MATIPPPPKYAPTAGQDTPATEWWRRSGPWSPNATRATVHLTKPSHPTTDDAAEPAGDPRIWVSEFADNLAERLGTRIGTILTETPDERAERERAEHEAKYEGKETDAQRRARHRREAIARRQRNSVLWRQGNDERAKRFRRWCILTALSAAGGYLLHLPQALTHVPLPVGVGALAVSWLFDRKMRGGGHVRVTQVRGPAALTYLCLVRIPLASALFAVLGLTPVFALTH
jgi:hypothetical protein